MEAQKDIPQKDSRLKRRRKKKNVALNQSDADLGLGGRKKKILISISKGSFRKSEIVTKNIQGIFSYDENSGATEQKEPKIYVRKL